MKPHFNLAVACAARCLLARRKGRA